MIFGFLVPLVPLVHAIMPFIVLVSFMALIFMVFYNFRSLKSFFMSIDWKIWLLILIILAANLAFLLSLPHYHKNWTDESMIILTAKNLMHLEYAAGYSKPIGAPFILAIIFFFFGLNYNVAIDASCVFGALSATMVFFIAYIMTGKKYLSLLSSVIFSLFASHIFWATSAESHVVSMFFALLAVFFCLLYYKEKKTSLFWLSCSALLFACLFRIEMAIFIILFFVGGIMFIPGFIKRLKERKYAICIIICTVFIIINFIGSQPYWGGSPEHSTLAEGGIWNSISNYAAHIFTGSLLFSLTGPSLFFCATAVFCIGGWTYCFFYSRKWAYFLAAWFVLANLFLVLIASANVEWGGIERFYTLILPVLAILPAYFLIFISSLLKKNTILSAIAISSLTLLILALSFFNMNHDVRLPDPSYDRLSFSESKLPLLLSHDFQTDCVMITFLPEIVSSSSYFKVYSTAEFLSNPLLRERLFNSTNCIVFVQGMLCDKDRPYNETFYGECQVMHEEYDLELNQSYEHYTNSDVGVSFAAHLVRKKETP